MATRLEFRAMKSAFMAAQTPEALCALLEEDPLDLAALALKPRYDTFEVPKRNGEMRLIEDPVPPLKAVQRKLNNCLQAVYYFDPSPAAYGFLAACDDDPPHQRRSIVNNARRHIGKPWMLNMDIEDFFHTISNERVATVFRSPPFDHDKVLASLLTRLCTFKGRLPMGAPSSPILSNYAARPLDDDIESLAKQCGWTYSRYADDMTVSSNNEITVADIELLRQCYRAHGFEPNESKTKLMGPEDPHSVTGILVLEDRLDLAQDFFDEIAQETRNLKDVASIKGRLGVSLSDWVDDYADRVRGMLTFAEHVLGKTDPKVQAARQALGDALKKPKDFGALSWNDWPYR